MLPSNSSPDAQTQKKQSKPLNFFQKTFNPIQNYISSYPLLWLSITFFLIQCVVISITRSWPPCLPNRKANATAVSAGSSPSNASASGIPRPESASQSHGETCPFGKVYVYDLPSIFNDDLLLWNCTDLEEYNFECGIATNHGFGSPAAELRHIVPENLTNLWYRTNQFSLEVIFRHRISQHKCRTTEPDSAAAFYIPFYGGLAVGKHLWNSDVSMRDRIPNLLLAWVTKQDYWKRSNGSNHFLTLGRITWDFRRLGDAEQKWGASFLNLPAMNKVTRFIIEKMHDDDNDVGMPYPTGLHPRRRRELDQWLDFVGSYNRTRLFTFAGATRPSATPEVRGILQSHCRNESDSCWLVDCGVVHCAADSSETMRALLGSEFCLQPAGDSATRKSVFDCMVAGSVPVFFWKETAYDQYEGFLPGDPESYSVYIDHEEVRSGRSQVKEVLVKFSKEEVRKKREKVMEIIPRIIYGDNEGGLMDFKDAFDVAIEGVLERIKEDKEWEGFL